MKSHNTLLEFAQKYRIRVKFDECHDSVVRGKFGHLYEHGIGLIGMVLEYKRNGPSIARSLVARRRKALAAGFQLHQAGDAEAILLFESGNGVQEKMAIGLVGAKRRRIASPSQLEALRQAREAFRVCKDLAQRPVQDAGTRESSG